MTRIATPLISLVAILIALATEVYLDLLPCAMCIGERLIFLALIANIITLPYATFHSTINLILSGAGVATAALHVYRGLSDTHSCGQSIFSRLDSHALTEHFPLLFEIKVLCSTKQGEGLVYYINEVMPFAALLIFTTLFIKALIDLKSIISRP